MRRLPLFLALIAGIVGLLSFEASALAQQPAPAAQAAPAAPAKKGKAKKAKAKKAKAGPAKQAPKAKRTAPVARKH